MTLLAFAAECRAAGRPPLSVDMSRPQGQQQQTRRTLLQRVNGTDGRTPYRCIDPAALYASSVNKKHSVRRYKYAV